MKGYKARMVQLVRQIGSAYDSHVVTEVLNDRDKKYIMLDPTFNLMFQDGEGFLNAFEIRQNYLYKRPDLEIVDNSLNIKGANMRQYYVNYYPLYNNVLVVKANNLVGLKRLLVKAPIVHYFWGRMYYAPDAEKSVAGYNLLYLIFYLYIPTIILTVIVLFFIITVLSRKQGRNS